MSLTVGERIILHLDQFSRFQDDFDVPIDVSQDGIALALRISRAHAAIELKKLKDSGEVLERLAHIKRGKTKRKVYFLSPSGMQRGAKVKEFAAREGIEITPFLDLKRCKASDLWSSLDEKFRPVMAQACVFRLPFKRSALPKTSISLLPEDQKGMVEMPSELRSSIPPLVDAPSLRQYHSFAADYWLGEGNYSERLYHLLQAGRSKEAEILVATKGNLLLAGLSNDLFESLKKVKLTSKYLGKGLYVRAEVARGIGRIDESMVIARELRGLEGRQERFLGLLVEGRALADKGEYQKSLEILIQGRDLVALDASLECEIAETLIRAGRYAEARSVLEPLLTKVAKDGEFLERVFYQLGIVALRSGDSEEAIKLLSKSRGAARNKDATHLLKALSEAYDKANMKEKSVEFATKARKAESRAAS